LPGKRKLPSGTYEVRIALIDKNNNNKNVIKMPIGDVTNTTAGYAIGTIRIKK
jgi:hypothetical protein